MSLLSVQQEGIFIISTLTYRDNENYNVVAFTAAQIPDIDWQEISRSELAGKFYPKGIPIFPEEKLPELIKKYKGQ